MKIAVASSDGESVDLHFGKAQNFLIFEFNGDKAEFLESREVTIDPEEKHQWSKSLQTIKDCEVVICVQAGMKGKFGLENAGIKLVEDEGPVGEVLERYIAHYKFMKKSL